jgi:hypothetical protein
MASSKNAILGTKAPLWEAKPGRSPGPLGMNDAADPDAGICIAGDTQGPVGTGGDLGAVTHDSEQQSYQAEIHVVAVDLEKMRRFLFTVAYAEAVDAAATRGFGSAEVELGDEREVKAAARQSADLLLEELQQAMVTGPEAVQSFAAEQEARRERAKASLQRKFDEALAAGRSRVSFCGGMIKVLSCVRFSATVTVKTLSLFTGPAGAGIDIAYSSGQAGIDQASSTDESKTVAGVVVDESVEEGLEELGETLNELVASGVMTRDEKNKLEGLIGSYKGNAEKLAEELDKLERRIRESLKAGASGKKVDGLVRRRVEKLAKLKELRVKTASSLLQKGRPIGLAKKAAGKTLSIVFLAQDVKDEWNKTVDAWRSSN